VARWRVYLAACILSAVLIMSTDLSGRLPGVREGSSLSRDQPPSKHPRADKFRWILLSAGWCLCAAFALSPGYSRPANAWAGERTVPAYAAVLSAAFAGLEPHNLQLGANGAWRFVVGVALLAGTVVFATSPLLMVLLRSRRLRYLWPVTVTLLAVWLPPLLRAADHRPPRPYLYGYYGLAAAYALVFAALLPWRGRSAVRVPVVRVP
jgi:hypothetical protein